jgi:hypothetical protein
MAREMTRPSSHAPTQVPNPIPETPAKSSGFEIDVDDAMIDDQHPKDTIQGGPPSPNKKGPAEKRSSGPA